MKKDSNMKSVETKESLEQIGKRLRKEQRDAKIKAFFKNKLSKNGYLGTAVRFTCINCHRINEQFLASLAS